jgi:signal transduction histidine kinase/ligand-binding sensor domain-containing protein
VPEGAIEGFAEDREGTTWVASLGGLARLEGDRWKKVGEDWGFPGHSAQTVFLDREGTLWVATENTLVFLPPGAKAFHPTGIYIGQVFQIVQAPNGKLWMPETGRSVRPIPLGSRQLPRDETEIRVGSTGILFDSEGALWMTTLGDGLRRASHPERLAGKPGRFSQLVENFTAKDGLTDDYAGSIFEDREGNIWVGTHSGLDCFRKSNFVPVALPAPLREPLIIAGDRGELWVQGINLRARIVAGRANAYRQWLTEDVIRKGHEIVTTDEPFRTAYRDSSGKVWLFSQEKLVRFENGRFTEFPLPQALSSHNGQQTMRVTEDRSGVLWVTAANAGLFSLKNGVWKRFEAPVAFPSVPRAAYTDWLGRAWFGYQGGEIIVVDEENIQLLSSKGSFEHLAAINGRGRHIWAGGNFGLAFYDGSRFQPVIPVDAQTLGILWGIEEDHDGGLWLGEYSGVVHVPENEIQHFLRDSSYRVRCERFDSLDGLPGMFRAVTGAQESQGTDGKIWFVTNSGLAWLDPAHIYRNPLPPPVSIRSLTVDGNAYPYWKNAALPPLTRSVQIQFTALSLSIPERVRFRYRLDGFDSDWRDAGTRREALYANLSPRKYRFHVIACNNDGVWNETGATLDFSVLPAWYQTIWFRSLCVAAFLVLLWALYQFRLQQLEQQFQVRIEGAVHERTRIARELHDTLLQSLHGLMFEFQAARNMFQKRPEEALQALDGAIAGTERAITEGQDAIEDLRSLTTAEEDLAQLIKVTGEDLAASQGGEHDSPTFGLTVEGHQRTLTPDIRDEVYRIARELLRNAFRHSQAHRIEAEILHDEDQFRLRVRDDGKGMDSQVLAKGRRPGHWGLPGARERAQQMGAKLDLWSQPGAGTEVQLAVAASVAYRKQSGRSRFRLFQKTGNDEHRP